jgi:hypothetical protein
VPAGPKGDVRLGDLAHRDRGLHAGDDAFLLEEVLQRKAVHHRAEHAHVVAAGPLHSTLLQLCPAEEVAAADDDGNLYTAADHLCYLPSHQVDDVRVQPHFPTAEHLAAELEHHAGVHRPNRRSAGGNRVGTVGAGWLRHPTPSGSSLRFP